MSKILATLTILGLCVSIAFSATATPTSQGTLSGLASGAVKVLSGANATEYTGNWPKVSGLNGVAFGPASGMTGNQTAYEYGLIPGTNTITGVIVRKLNASNIALASDTTEASVLADSAATAGTAIKSTSLMSAVAPGYLAILATDTSSVVSFNLVTAASASIASTSVATATATYTLGNVWYDLNSTAFFYTYSSVAASTTTIYVGGMFVNGTVFWTKDLVITPATPANAVTNVMGGGDGWLNSSNIYVTWRDTTAKTIYFSKTAKVSNSQGGSTVPAAGGAATSLVVDTSNLAYLPIGVWAGYNVSGIACSLVNTTSGTAVNTIALFNSLPATTSVDSGLGTFTGVPTLVNGAPYTTGYALLATYPGSTYNGYTYGTFFANGTLNGTSVTSISTNLAGAVTVYEDVNGTMWMGWNDIDTANTNVVYNSYLAKLFNQINPSSANVLSTLLAFVALFLAAVFAF
jgi:hypothetical protein